MTKLLILSPLFVFLFYSDAFAFGSCETQSGHWTKLANSASIELESAIKAIRSKAECNTLSQALDKIVFSNLHDLNGRININQDESDKKNELDQLNNASEINSLMGIAQSFGGSAQSSKVLQTSIAQLTTRSASIPRSLMIAAKNATEQSINYLDNILDIVNSDVDGECLRVSGAPVGQILTGSAQLLSTLTGSSYSNNNKISGITQKVLKMTTDQRFSSALTTKNTLDFWNDISCIIESTTDNYCAIRDARELNQKLMKYDKLYSSTFISDSSEYNPLEAYFVLSRDIPNIANWSLKVLFGTDPITMFEANRKNTIWETMIGFLKDENRAIAIVNEKYLEMESIYKRSTSVNGKKQKIVEILQMITQSLSSSDLGESGSVNFITSNYPRQQIPFILMGRDTLPPPITGISPDGQSVWRDTECGGRQYELIRKYRWDEFLVNSGDFHCSLDNPDEVLVNIRYNMTKLLLIGKTQALDYLQDFLVVDEVNLISELYKDVGVSVYESLINVYNYVEKLSERTHKEIIKNKKELEALSPNSRQYIRLKQKAQEYQSVYGNTLNLLPKLDRVFEALDKEAYAKKEEDKAVLAKDAIFTVFKEFNVLYQQSNFLGQRIKTFTEFDMRTFLRQERIDKELESFLVVNARNLMAIMENTINEGFRESPATQDQNIKTALAIANTNLGMLESTTKDFFVAAINSLDAIQKGRYGDFDYNLNMLGKLLKYENSRFKIYDELVSSVNKSDYEKNETHRNYVDLLYTPTQPINPVTMVKNFFGSIRNMLYHKDRYPLVWKVDPDEVWFEDYGKDGSFKLLKDKFCVQSLFYQNNRGLLNQLCKGTVLDNPMVRESFTRDEAIEKELIVSFDHFAANSQPNYKRVCALRNYKRNNKAIILLDKIDSQF